MSRGEMILRTYVKRSMLSMLALSVMLPPFFASASISEDQAVEPVPGLQVMSAASPLFYWDFDPELMNGETGIVNRANPQESADEATLKGTAAIVTDELRGDVLSLSGGSNGSGWLELPDHLYREVEEELTFAVWANLDQATGSYTRLLSSTIGEKGLSNSGINGWRDTEFVVVAGGGSFNNRVYTGTNPNEVASYRGDIVWNANPARGRWQHIAITMTSDGGYEVYFDGRFIGASRIDPGNSTAEATLATTLDHFFQRDFLDALTFNDFGRSFYTSDGDTRGKFDDIRLYNAKLTAEQVDALYEETKHEEVAGEVPAKITVDLADRSLGPVFHGSAGALYAISEPNVPDINTLIPIKPSHITQKPPNGIQHPTGDALRVADYFFEAGGEVVNIVMQDYYQRWYYPSRTAEQYINEAVIPITEAVKAFKQQWAAENPGQNPDEKFIYIPYNEPEQDNTRYPQLLADNQTGRNSRAVFNNDWLAVTNKIKEIDPGAVISGVNLTQYGAKVFEDFIPFCVEHDCLPEITSWHMLWNKAFAQAAGNIATYRSVEEKAAARYRELYPDRELPFPIKVDINEYAAPAEIAVGGSLVQYIARYDELKMNSMLPYWNTANSYGSLLAGQNEPNGSWWLYKWYADMMGGDMAKVGVTTARSETDAYGPGLYGLSSIQDEKEQVSIAFGGTKGSGSIVFNHVTGHANSPAFLAGAEQVHVTVWHAGYTGLTGFLVEPTQIVDRNYPVKNGSVTLDVQLDDYTAAYFAVITPAVNSDSHEVWFKRFEAEHAEVKTNVTTASVYPVSGNANRSASNGQYVQGIRQQDSVVKWTNVTVPADGSYRLDLIGGSGATANMPNQANTGQANQRINSEWFIKIDDQPSFKVVLRADYNMQLLGGNTIYIDLEEGTHAISISKFNPDTGEAGQGEATLDAMELTYNGERGASPAYRVQAEFAEYDTARGLVRGSSLGGFEGAGYVTGYGEMAGANTRFVVSVLDDGMYDVTIRYAADSSGHIRLDHDRKHVADIPVVDTNGQWQDARLQMFLRTGINLIDVKASAGFSLDYVDAVFAGQTPIFSIEAEESVIVGEPAGSELPLIRAGEFARYTSGGKYVNGITSYDGAERYLEIDTIEVPADGLYKLVVTYANGESAGTHAYNNDVVERYAQISVNGGEPQTVFFKNTISWHQFATQTIDVELKAGMNKIRFSNNNTYDGGSNPYGGNNGSGTQGFTHYTAVPRQYTPAFDRFDLYPQTTSVSAAASAVLAGEHIVRPGQSLDVIYGLRGVQHNVLAQDITIQYDADKLDAVGSPLSLNSDNFLVVDYVEEAGSTRILGIHLGDLQTKPNQDVMKLKYQAKDIVGMANVRVSNLILADESGVESGAGGATHTIQIQKPTIPGDFNNDGRVSVGDLANMAKAYGKTSDSPDWDQVKAYDMNNDGIIDIEDLVMLARLILAK
ncbi:LamG-like jellyroll fold domain-containing protein [Paenibacillus sp. 1P07SE]|uniref:LamG-like jellyroll fold domain-containing protein n=1 Tax=Paenibacillus sp. 1P07SE TaxID=3132209 RepID=UPI0039A63485